MNINDAFNITKPLTDKEKQRLHDIAVDLAKPGTLFIQDSETPLCIQCGQRLNINGSCNCCGSIKRGPAR